MKKSEREKNGKEEKKINNEYIAGSFDGETISWAGTFNAQSNGTLTVLDASRSSECDLSKEIK